MAVDLLGATSAGVGNLITVAKHNVAVLHPSMENHKVLDSDGWNGIAAGGVRRF